MNASQWDQVITELRKPNGWIRRSFGAWRKPDGGVCLLGAMRRVGDDNSLLQPKVLRAIVLEQFPSRAGSGGLGGLGCEAIAKFNDHPDTTLDDVIMVCEKARANAEETS